MFKTPLRNLVTTLSLVALQPVDCGSTPPPVKRESLKISRRAIFWKIPMHVIELSTELQNAEISHLTLLKGDSTTDSLPATLKILGPLTEIICSGASFQHRYPGLHT